MKRKCKACGECCAFLIDTREKIYCPALDLETRRCMIFDRRMELSADLCGFQCGRIDRQIARREAPEGCALIAFAYYKRKPLPKIMDVEAAQIRVAIAKRREAIRKKYAPAC